MVGLAVEERRRGRREVGRERWKGETDFKRAASFPRVSCSAPPVRVPDACVTLVQVTDLCARTPAARPDSSRRRTFDPFTRKTRKTTFTPSPSPCPRSAFRHGSTCYPPNPQELLDQVERQAYHQDARYISSPPSLLPPLPLPPLAPNRELESRTYQRGTRDRTDGSESAQRQLKEWS